MQLFADRVRIWPPSAFPRVLGLLLSFFIAGAPDAWAFDSGTLLGPPRLKSVSQGFSIQLPPESPITPQGSAAYTENNFNAADPICDPRNVPVVSQIAASGICGNVGQILFVPREVSFGDRTVDVESQCVQLEKCYQSGSSTKQVCDAAFRSRMEGECQRVVGTCGSLLGGCLALVDGYAEVVGTYGELDEIATGATAVPEEAVPQPQVATKATQDQPARSGDQWVYVGEFDQEWISRNFDVQEMIASGSSMTAIKYVNVRGDHIRKDPESEKWTNAAKVGVVAPGESVRIAEVTNLGRSGSSAQIWARIER